MKKLVETTTLVLALAACSQTSPDGPDTAGPNESDTTHSAEPTETTPADPTTESASPEKPSVPETTPLPAEGVTIGTQGFTTTVQASGDTLTITQSYPGREPITLPTFTDPGASKELGTLHATAASAGCETGPVVYTPWQASCAASDEFVHAVHKATEHSPLVNPSTVTITVVPDLPDGQTADPIIVEYTKVTQGNLSAEIKPELMGELYYAIVTLLTAEPSGEVCDTAAGATLALDLDSERLYEGNFGMCDFDVPDYQSFTTITDILGLR